MKRIARILVIAAGMVASAGCSTIVARRSGDLKYGHHDGVYLGVKTWPSYTAARLDDPRKGWGMLEGKFGPLALPFVAADLGLSFGIDTVMFPVDGIYSVTYRHEKPTPPARR